MLEQQLKYIKQRRQEVVTKIVKMAKICAELNLNYYDETYALIFELGTDGNNISVKVYKSNKLIVRKDIYSIKNVFTENGYYFDQTNFDIGVKFLLAEINEANMIVAQYAKLMKNKI